MPFPSAVMSMQYTALHLPHCTYCCTSPSAVCSLASANTRDTTLLLLLPPQAFLLPKMPLQQLPPPLPIIPPLPAPRPLAILMVVVERGGKGARKADPIGARAKRERPKRLGNVNGAMLPLLLMLLLLLRLGRRRCAPDGVRRRAADVG